MGCGGVVVPRRQRAQGALFGARRSEVTKKKPIFDLPMLRFDALLRLTSTMEEFEFTARILPLRDRMFRYAQSLLLSSAEAEDAVHDLLERLWREHERLAPRRNLDALVMAAVRNRCYDLLRKRRADERRDDTLGRGSERMTTSDAERWEARELVRRAMASLPARQREALHLKDIEGYPTGEVAELLGCDEAQVRVILSRARHTMREVLKKMMDDESTGKKE